MEDDGLSDFCPNLPFLQENVALPREIRVEEVHGVGDRTERVWQMKLALASHQLEGGVSCERR